MRIWWAICILGISSCAGTHELISPDTINKEIQYDVSIIGPAELMQKIYPYQDSTDVLIDWKELRNKNSYKIFLTHTPTQSNSKITLCVHASHIHSVWHIEKIKRKTKAVK